MSHQPITAIVPAAGIGSRMQSELPKQYLPINNTPILALTLQRLLALENIDKIIVALHKDDTWFAALPEAEDSRVVTVMGGDSRAQSVTNALQICESEHWALVHDAARPCVSLGDIQALIQCCYGLSSGGAILACKAVDTLKQASPKEHCKVLHTLDRSDVWHALTPQMFRVADLLKAYLTAQSNQRELTDEASAIEHYGLAVHLVASQRSNIKITYPQDLALAGYYLNEENNT